eukprot:3499977-Rhodomonas_salina.1
MFVPRVPAGGFCKSRPGVYPGYPGYPGTREPGYRVPGYPGTQIKMGPTVRMSHTPAPCRTTFESTKADVFVCTRVHVYKNMKILLGGHGTSRGDTTSSSTTKRKLATVASVITLITAGISCPGPRVPGYPGTPGGMCIPGTRGTRGVPGYRQPGELVHGAPFLCPP